MSIAIIESKDYKEKLMKFEQLWEQNDHYIQLITDTHSKQNQEEEEKEKEKEKRKRKERSKSEDKVYLKKEIIELLGNTVNSAGLIFINEQF